MKHYLIDVLEPTEEFHVVVSRSSQSRPWRRSYENGLIPIVAGGTGVLYSGTFV